MPKKEIVKEKKEGILQRFFAVVAPAWTTVKEYGKALIGGTVYQYGFTGFLGGESSRYMYKRYRTIFQRMGFVRQAILAYKHRIATEPAMIMSHSKSVMLLLEDRFKAMEIWENHYEWITQDLLQFGDSFSEIIYSQQNYRVIGLKRLEPESIYIRRDRYGRPELYIIVKRGIPITLEPYRMMHIKMDSQPGAAFGVGLIEGGMDDLAALRILEDLNIQLAKHNVYPHRVYTCPTNDVVLAIEAKLAEQERFGDLVVPDGVKAQQMNSGGGIDLRGYMLYYQQKFFLDSGVPMDMLIKGTGGNRSTASEMQSAFNGNARAIQKKILFGLEWFGELVLASEGIVANIVLVPPEIDKALEFAKRKEFRELFQEGLISRAYAQELLKLNHPLNILPTAEDFAVQLNQDAAIVAQYQAGLLARPYAIELLGHDVEANQPSMPQAPAFSLPQPVEVAEPTDQIEPTPPAGEEPDDLDADNVSVVKDKDASDKTVVKEGKPSFSKIGLSLDVEDVEVVLVKNSVDGVIDTEVYQELSEGEMLNFQEKIKLLNNNGGNVMGNENVKLAEEKMEEKETTTQKPQEDKKGDSKPKTTKKKTTKKKAVKPDEMPKIPNYFKPTDSHPVFADIFGDNEYSIRKPQRHVERIREEMLDAFGQQHKRVHERVREHHKPITPDKPKVGETKATSVTPTVDRKKVNETGTGALSDKKTLSKNASRQWVQRHDTVTLKQGQSEQDFVLAAIDVSFQKEGESWVQGLGEIADKYIDILQKRILNHVKRAAATSQERGKIDKVARDGLVATIASEIVTVSVDMNKVMNASMYNLYSAGLNFTNTVFAISTPDSGADVLIDTNLKMLEERMFIGLGLQMSTLFSLLEDDAVVLDVMQRKIVSIVDRIRMSGKNLVVAMGHGLFRKACKGVIQHPAVASDIIVVDFIVPDLVKACKTCQSHNLSSSEIGLFEFEACQVCNTTYRFYFDEE